VQWVIAAVELSEGQRKFVQLPIGGKFWITQGRKTFLEADIFERLLG